MKFRIRADDLVELGQKALTAFGALLNRAQLRVSDVEHRPEERTVTFSVQRYPVTGRTFFTGTRHATDPVSSLVTIRNVTDCRVEDTKECETIQVLFGLKLKRDEVRLCSVEEASGVTCYELRCRISTLDLEIEDAEESRHA